MSDSTNQQKKNKSDSPYERQQAADEIRIPFNSEAEAAILGNLMMNFERMSICRRMNLAVGDFFVEGHRIIYRTMQSEVEAHVEQFDPISLVTYLRASGELDRVGGHARISALLDGIVRFYADSLFENYIRVVKEASRRRALMRQANLTLAEIGDGEKESGEIARDLQRLAEDVQAGDVEPSPTIASLVNSAKQRLTNRLSHPQRGARSGFRDLDDIVQLLPGHLCVLAARTRVGKSTFAFQWILQTIRDKAAPLLMTFEMSAEQITDRLLMLSSRVNGGHFLSGALSQDEWIKFRQAEELVHSSRLRIIDRATPTLATVKGEVRAAHQKAPIDLLILDHLGLMTGRGENRVADVSDMTRGLKLLARDLEIPILCLAQLNRAIEGRRSRDSNPRLSDLRESGSIEQDADQVIFLTRDLETDADLTEAHIAVEKNRHGRGGQVRVAFNKQFGGYC